MKTEKEIEEKIYELSKRIRDASHEGDMFATSQLLQQQTALKWVLA